MEQIGTITKKRYNGSINDNNDNKYINDINVNRKNRYSLNSNNFKPNTQESSTAIQIATDLNDLNNFAFYYRVVKTIGITESVRLLKTVLQDVEVKKKTKYPVRNVKKYFVWVYKNKRY